MCCCLLLGQALSKSHHCSWDIYPANTMVCNKSPIDTECAAAIKAVRDEYLAALMLSGCNRERYSALRVDLRNDFALAISVTPRQLTSVSLSSIDGGLLLLSLQTIPVPTPFNLRLWQTNPTRLLFLSRVNPSRPPNLRVQGGLRLALMRPPAAPLPSQKPKMDLQN